MESQDAFPLPAARFSGDSRQVDPGACFDWLRQGWAMFIEHPGVWIGSAVIVLVMIMAISIVPLFGQMAVNILLPLFSAGMLAICRRQSLGETPEIGDLFTGFKKNTGPLVIVGAFYTVGVFGIAFVAFLLISGSLLGGAITGRVAGFGFVFGSVMLATLLVMVLSVPVVMAAWFAPALVFFNDMKPLDAMKASFAAGSKNWLAMSVFGLMLMVAAFFASLPLFMGWMLLLPVFSASVYASYRDIFPGT